MKIYNEITIDMNPESDTFKEVLSEVSHEYNGDVALCGDGPMFGRHKYKVGSGHKGSPGIHAMLGGGGGGVFGDQHKHPSNLPSNMPFLAEYGGVGTQYDPRGKDIGSQLSSTIKAGVDPDSVTGQTKRHWRFGKTKYPRAHKLMDKATKYGEDFRTGWYDPYMEQSEDIPLKFSLGTEAAGGNPQGAFMNLSDALNLAKQGTIFEGQNLTPEGLEDYGVQGGDIGELGYTAGTPLITRASQGGITSAVRDLGTAKETYESELENLEGLRTEAKSETEKSRLEQRQARQDILRGVIPEFEKRGANISRTGMAYSAPAELRTVGDEAGTEKSLAGVVSSERDISDQLRQKMLDFGVQEEGIKSDYETAKGRYETDVASALDSSSLTDIFSHIGDLGERHRTYGQELDTAAQVKSGGWNTGGYKYRGLGGADTLTGSMQNPYAGINTPAGGWFTPYARRPVTRGSEQVASSVNQLQQYLAGAGLGQISSAIPGE